MMFLLAISALFFAAAAPAPRQQSGTGVEYQLQAHATAAAEKVSRQDFQGALKEYETILRLRPESQETRANAGMMRHLLGDTSGAVADFELALHLNPKLEAATLLCGLDLLTLHRPTEAINYLRRAIELNPRESRATTGLGEALFSLDRPEEALSSYQRSLQLDPGDTGAAYGAGLAYLGIMRDAVERISKLGRDSVYSRVLLADAKAAQSQWQDVVEILSEIPDSGSSDLPCISASLGLARLHAGQTALAETEFRRERPNNICPLNAIGLTRIAFERGDIPAGLYTLENAWQSDPMVIKANLDLLWSGLDDASVIRIRGALESAASVVKAGLMTVLIASLDVPERAETESKVQAHNDFLTGSASPELLCGSGHYTTCAAALRPLFPSLTSKRLLLLAQSAFYSGDPDTSLKAAVRVLRVDPGEPAGLFWKARAAQRLALVEFAAMQRSAPDSPHFHFLMAEAYRQQDSLEAAQQEYRKVLATSPDDVPARIGLARVLIASDDPNATELLKAVLARDRTNAEASYMLGDLLVSQVRYAEARPFLEIALRGGEDYGIRAHSLLARIDYEDGNWSDALKELQPCLKFDRRGTYHYRLYQIYKKLGDGPDAAEAFRTAKLLLAQADRQ
jgi:tetratricopeptide (TPR) repeat protein